LILWRPGAIKAVASISLPAWTQNEQELWASTECKFIAGESRIVCAHGPWLSLSDVRAKMTIRHVMGLQNFSGLNWENAAVEISKKIDRDKMPSSPVVLAVDPKEGRVAVAYNTLKSPMILVFSRDLRTRVASWQAPKYVQNLFWSPDGRHLGALYYNYYDGFDQRGKWTGWHPSKDLAEVPDVSIFDISTEKEILTFATAGFEAKATFSADGKLIYVIPQCRTDVGNPWGWPNDTLRAFSSTTGELIRTFKVSGSGVRNNFAISPDGSFIAAESSKPAHSDVHYLVRLRENLGGDLNSGFVILDTDTGRVIFRENRQMSGNLPGTLPLFFSANSDLLIAEFGQPPDRLIAYSVSR
jgi:hypothetical protein